MNLSYFFDGTLRKEEVASALLASLLADRADFRRALFERVAPGEVEALVQKPWRVAVEADRVDVRLETDDTVCLIENKLRAGAKQAGQLLDYYLALLERGDSRRVLAIYVAPGSIGVDEVERVRTDPSFRHDDTSAHISWESLLSFADTLAPTDSDHAAVTSAFERIAEVLRDDRAPKYPREGLRAVVASIADAALDELRSRFPDIQLSDWRLRNGQEILTNRTDVTMWLDLTFELDTDGEPIEDRDGDALTLAITSQFKLAGRVAKSSEFARQWQRHVDASAFEVPGRGAHELGAKSWFVRRTSVTGNVRALTDALVDAGAAVLRVLAPYVADA